MSVTLNPYIHRDGDAAAALAFYHSVFGGELTSTTFAEGGTEAGPDEGDKIMHGQLVAPSGLTLMVADAPAAMPTSPGKNISISLSGGAEDDAVLRGCFDALAQGGETFVPLETAPWGDTFGMLADRFGIEWLVNIAGAAA